MARLNLIEKTMCAADALRAMLVARWRVRPFWRKMYVSEELIAERRIENAGMKRKPGVGSVPEISAIEVDKHVALAPLISMFCVSGWD